MVGKGLGIRLVATYQMDDIQSVRDGFALLFLDFRSGSPYERHSSFFSSMALFDTVLFDG